MKQWRNTTAPHIEFIFSVYFIQETNVPVFFISLERPGQWLSKVSLMLLNEKAQMLIISFAFNAANTQCAKNECGVCILTKQLSWWLIDLVILLLSTRSRVTFFTTAVAFQWVQNAKNACVLCFGCRLKYHRWWKLMQSPPLQHPLLP